MRNKLLNKIAMDIVEILYGDNELSELLDTLKEKGYLDRKEAPPRRSIADEKWAIRELPGGKYCIYKEGNWYAPHIASSIPTLELATAISALPKLVRAARNAVYALQNGVNESLANTALQEALEKAEQEDV